MASSLGSGPRGAAMGALLVGLASSAGCGDNLAGGPEPPVLYAGNVWGGNLAVADGQVYFTTFDHGPELDHAVLRLPVDGGEPTLLWHSAPHQIFGFGMAVDDGEVFWSQQDDDAAAVFSVPVAGGERAKLGRFTAASAPYQGVTAGADWVFAASDAQIVRVPRRGGPADIVFAGDVQWIDRQDGPLYLLAGEVLQRLDPDSARVEPVAPVPGAVHFALAGGVAYVAAGDAVWRVPLAGGPPVQLLTGLGPIDLVAVGAHDLFVVVRDDGPYVVMRVPLDGTPPEALYHTRSIAPTMVVDGDVLFLAFCCEDNGSTGGGRVVRLDL